MQKAAREPEQHRLSCYENSRKRPRWQSHCSTGTLCHCENAIAGSSALRDQRRVLLDQLPPQSGIVLAFENPPDIFRAVIRLVHGVPDDIQFGPSAATGQERRQQRRPDLHYRQLLPHRLSQVALPDELITSDCITSIASRASAQQRHRNPANPQGHQDLLRQCAALQRRFYIGTVTFGFAVGDRPIVKSRRSTRIVGSQIGSELN